jgi:hypothetical protein
VTFVQATRLWKRAIILAPDVMVINARMLRCSPDVMSTFGCIHTCNSASLFVHFMNHTRIYNCCNLFTYIYIPTHDSLLLYCFGVINAPPVPRTLGHAVNVAPAIIEKLSAVDTAPNTRPAAKKLSIKKKKESHTTR